jgi:hypothetical protein
MSKQDSPMDPHLRRAVQGVRRQAPEAQKQDLVRHLRQLDGRKVSLWDRILLIVERRWPELRLPVYGLSFASFLVVVAVGLISFSAAGIDAPEVDDIEFPGSSAVVIEGSGSPTTLIWLSDADWDDVEADDDPSEVEEVEEVDAGEEVEDKDI